MHRIFLLSPANSAGARARMLFSPRARFDLATRLQSGQNVALAEVFSFLSGLYFRGKAAYANRFALPPDGLAGAWVITSGRGLLPAGTGVGLKDLSEFGKVAVDAAVPAYTRPLCRDVQRLAKRTADGFEFVLLGSIGTTKYVDVLLPILGDRLRFPPAFVGRGDMSRGGLMLRCVAENRELDYVAVDGAVRRGTRPPKLTPRNWGFKITEGVTRIAQ